jgi:subtilisin-like proprotein convertase family protein
MQTYFRICLLVLSLMFGCVTRAAAVDYPEVEPNESKDAADQVPGIGLGMNPFDTISGVTTGAGGVGAASADYFLVKTAPAASGVYEYTLILSSTTPGHSLSIRGLSQTAGIINAASDVTFQEGHINYPGTPADSRTIKWYGFGTSEQLYIRVTGNAFTTSPYSIQLQRAAVAPSVLVGGVFEGLLTVARGLANVSNTDVWMYNSALGAIAGYGNDGSNALSRSFSPGVYYIAISDSNVANNAASPVDDSFRDGNVLDFSSAIASSSPATGLNMDVRVISPTGAAIGTGNKPNPFDMKWYCFNVVPNTTTTVPQGYADAAPLAISNCGDAEVCLTVRVTPGTNPTSTNLQVVMNLSSIGGPTSVQLRDDGQSCDEGSGDRVFGVRFTIPAFVNPGIITLPYTIRDGQSRVNEQVLTRLEIVSCEIPRPPNERCIDSVTIRPGDVVTGNTFNASADGGVPNCVAGSSPQSPGVWYRVIGTGKRMTVSTCASQGRFAFDTVLNVYCGSQGCNALTCVASGDDECAELAQATWCTEPGIAYYILVRGKKGTDRGAFTLTLLEEFGFCFDSERCGPVGACCFTDSCLVVSPWVCQNFGGTFLGVDAPCDNLRLQRVASTVTPMPLAIPDNDRLGVEALINIPANSGTIDALVVGVKISHSWLGDLIAQFNRNSTEVTLFNRVGRAGSGFGDSSNLSGEYFFVVNAADLWLAAAGVGNFDPVPPGPYAPSRASDGLSPSPNLNVFNGVPYAGTWKLVIADVDSGEVGEIQDFSIYRIVSEPACTFCPPCAADFNIDGGIDGSDVAEFFNAWSSASPCADVNEDGGIDGLDVQSFFDLWSAGGCS